MKNSIFILIVFISLISCNEKAKTKNDFHKNKSGNIEKVSFSNESKIDTSSDKISINYVKLGNIFVRTQGARRVSDDVWRR